MTELQPILLSLLAEGNGAQEPGGLFRIEFIIPAMGVLFYFMIIRPERKKRKAQQTQMDELKKNDRVVTIGGIHGTVASVNRDADEVVLKIDESTGTKIRVSTSSIGRVVDDSTDENNRGKT